MESEEGGHGNLEWQPSQAESVGNLGTHILQLASEVGSSLVGLNPQPVGSALTLVGARTEGNCRTPSWCHREYLSAGKSDRSVVSVAVCGAKGGTHKCVFSKYYRRQFLLLTPAGQPPQKCPLPAPVTYKVKCYLIRYRRSWHGRAQEHARSAWLACP